MAAAQVRTPSVSTPGRRRASRRSWPRAKISAKRISQGTGATRPASSTHASQVTAMRAGSKQTASAPTFCTSTRRSIAGALLPWPDAPTVRQSAVCATVAQAAADPTRRRATIFAWRGVSHVRGANCRRASSRYARAHVAAPHWRTETALAARVRPRRWPSQRRSNQRARTTLSQACSSACAARHRPQVWLSRARSKPSTCSMMRCARSSGSHRSVAGFMVMEGAAVDLLKHSMRWPAGGRRKTDAQKRQHGTVQCKQAFYAAMGA